MTHWSRAFWSDLAERVGSTFLQALLGVLVATNTPALDWSDYRAVWVLLGIPTAASLIKGLLANMAQPESGASLLPTPPGPDLPGVHPDGHPLTSGHQHDPTS